MSGKGQWSGLLVDLVPLLICRLVYLCLIPARTVSGEMTKLVACKTGSVIESVRVLVRHEGVGRFHFAQEQDFAEGNCCCLAVVIHSAEGQPVVGASVVPLVVYSGFVGRKETFRGGNRAYSNFSVLKSAPLRQYEDCQIIFVSIQRRQ